jgi:hypothetical protein
MIEEEDRLPDWAYMDEELDAFAKKVLEGLRFGESGHLVLYHLYKNGEKTNIVMLLSVKSVLDGMGAINRLWASHNIHAEVGEYCEIESNLVGYKLNALEIVLDKFKYEGKIELPGSNKLYKYNKWFDVLIT